jgi:demethylmenaquinone methyltransferase/2-methoxy-6-polyprenyl-1,4-benzoquinol methylase
MTDTAPERNFALEYDHSYKKYDLIVQLFQLGRDRAHRIRALKLAGLKQGDIVLDLCCGSGLSFGPIRSLIGSKGRIIAVDANKNMLEIAKKRASRKNWTNIEFIQSDIGTLNLDVQADLALFAFCWYDAKVGARWVQKVSESLKPDSGVFCFIDYKYPENWVKKIASPVLSVLVKWLGEAYSVEDLKWDPRTEIGGLLHDPGFQSYYFDSIFVIHGGPIISPCAPSDTLSERSGTEGPHPRS